MDLTLADFAQAVGPADSGPVWVKGRETRLASPPGVRTVQAPRGIGSLRADEMIVECGAGTAIDELQDALREVGQYVNLPVRPGDSGTVGGALALGHSDIRRLGRGAVRDAVLRIRFVDHDGQIITAGGSTVKNVSGFDLCRLLVGSRGALGFFGEVLLRTRPLPRSSRWFSVLLEDPAILTALVPMLYRPSAVLWNGKTALICLEGHDADISATVQAVQSNSSLVLEETSAPDLRGFDHRWSIAPSRIPALVVESPGECWAEIGVGTVHHRRPAPVSVASSGVATITERLLRTFDPAGRLNPGQAPSQGASAAH